MPRRRQHRCRAPVRLGQQRMCGRPVVAGEAYCLFHAEFYRRFDSAVGHVVDGRVASAFGSAALGELANFFGLSEGAINILVDTAEDILERGDDSDGIFSETGHSVPPPRPRQRYHVPIPPPTALYNVLGVDPKAPQGTIRKAYLASAKRHHPDRGGDEEWFKRVVHAWEILRDPETREKYDNRQLPGETS